MRDPLPARVAYAWASFWFWVMIAVFFWPQLAILSFGYHFSKK